MISRIQKVFLEEQKEWIDKHRYYMGFDKNNEISGNEAYADFAHGNDRHFDNGQPTPELNHHLSPRNLTWEVEYNIYFWNKRLLEFNPDEFTKEDVKWIGKKWDDMKERALLKYGVLELVAC